ncbi:proteasome component M29 [Ascosphaera atra]|nr:proteasome component M29 [Ascosphaera atra]
MLNIILREAKRNNVKYRPHGLKALGDFALGRRDITILGEALAIVQPIVEECISDDSSPDNDMDKREQAK